MRTFMSGIPARDYIFQTEPYEEQIKKAAKLIREADYILFGLGAGMSTAAGAQYGGDFFKENFGEFMEKYGAGLICRTCTVQVFIRIRMRNLIGGTGHGRRLLAVLIWM